MKMVKRMLYNHRSRKTLYNYSEKDEFFPTIKKARDRVEMDIERRMNDKNAFTPGLIFNAKNNFGWVDKNETDLKVSELKGLVGLETTNEKENNQ